MESNGKPHQHAKPSFWASEFVRTTVANTAGLIGGVVAYFVVRPDTGMEWGALGWTYLTCYYVISILGTFLAYARLRGDTLTDALLNGDAYGPRWTQKLMANPKTRIWLAGGSALVWALAISLTSLILALTLIGFARVNHPSLALMATGIPAVIASWIYLLVVYAEHYAREDAQHGGVSFPGTDERVFSDYVYLALAGHTTFGTTDVELGTARLRRMMTGQSIAAFLFNTVILAVLISLLTS